MPSSMVSIEYFFKTSNFSQNPLLGGVAQSDGVDTHLASTNNPPTAGIDRYNYLCCSEDSPTPPTRGTPPRRGI
jgi:hypothetical protein